MRVLPLTLKRGLLHFPTLTHKLPTCHKAAFVPLLGFLDPLSSSKDPAVTHTQRGSGTGESSSLRGDASRAELQESRFTGLFSACSNAHSHCGAAQEARMPMTLARLLLRMLVYHGPSQAASAAACLGTLWDVLILMALTLKRKTCSSQNDFASSELLIHQH